MLLPFSWTERRSKATDRVNSHQFHSDAREASEATGTVVRRMQGAVLNLVWNWRNLDPVLSTAPYMELELESWNLCGPGKPRKD